MSVAQEIRYAARGLARAPGLTLAAVLSLGLGAGANTTIFTLLNAILLKSLPVEDPGSLSAVYTADERNPGLLLCSYPNYRDYQERNTAFSSLLLYTPVTVNLTGRGDPRLLMAQLASGNYFSALGISPPVGRGFLPEEDAVPGAAAVAVLSYGTWTREFDRDPQVTSRSITLNGRAFQIVGVAPPGFQGLDDLYAADVWVPVAMYRELYPNPAWVEQRRALLFAVVGRRKPGVGQAQAEARLQVLAGDLEREYPKDNQGRRIRLKPVTEAAINPATRATLTSGSAVLMIVSALVLLIACANVANLLLARATGRSREIAVRLAMGASRGRIVRQLLTESLLLGVLGGGAGLAMARWTGDLLWSLRPSTLAHAVIRMDLDAHVLAYSLGIAVLTGLLFGLAPALRATSRDLATDLKERTGQEARSRRAVRPRSVLVAAQVAFSVIALVGAGLFVRSIQNAARIDLGFDASRLAAVAFNLAGTGYNETRGREYQVRALDAAASVPGVVSAALAKDVPLRVSAARTVMPEGQEDGSAGAGRVTLTQVVTPGYFRTMGIPLRQGRDFGATDAAQMPRVAVVNETAAARFWPGENPLGKRIHFFGDKVPAEVVGVVRNATYRAIGEEPQALLYLSLLQYYFPTAAVYLRTNRDPDAVAAAVRRAMQPLDRNLLLQSEGFLRTIQELLWVQRLSAGLLALFGLLALLLATVGIYGVVSYSVNRRVREMGVRMALGATGADVRRMIVREGIRPVVLGVVAGLTVAMFASRLVAHMLFAIDPRDAATFVVVPAVLTAVGLAACWIPAWRTSRILPGAALRDE
jgi:predicted permease